MPKLFLVPPTYEIVDLSFLPVDHVLDVDLDKPKSTYPFIVSPFTEYEDADGKSWDGFTIMIRGDVVDFSLERYSAKLLENGNHILLTVPSTEDWYLNHLEQYFYRQQQTGHYCQAEAKGHNVTRNEIVDDATLKSVTVLLRFPQGIVLTTKEFNDDHDNSGVLDSRITVIGVEQEVNNMEQKRIIDVVTWKVGIHEDKRRNINAPVQPERRSAMDKISEQMASMGTQF